MLVKIWKFCQHWDQHSKEEEEEDFGEERFF
jgi:hypothetical protein